MVEVFLAHKSSDDALADLLADGLARQFGVFVDHRDIPAGSNWDQVIVHALGEARVVIALLSAERLRSSPLLAGEVETARGQGKLLPVWVGGLPMATAAIPPVLRVVQGLPWSPPDAGGLEVLLPDLRQALLHQGLDGRPKKMEGAQR